MKVQGSGIRGWGLRARVSRVRLRVEGLRDLQAAERLHARLGRARTLGCWMHRCARLPLPSEEGEREREIDVGIMCREEFVTPNPAP